MLLSGFGDESRPQLPGRRTVLSLGTFCGRGRSTLCFYRVLRLYFAGNGVLFHDILVHLQGLSENLHLFFVGDDRGIFAISGFKIFMSLEYRVQHALRTDDWIFPDCDFGICDHKTVL